MLKNCFIFFPRKVFQQWQTLAVFQREGEGRKSLASHHHEGDSANCNSPGLFIPRIAALGVRMCIRFIEQESIILFDVQFR